MIVLAAVVALFALVGLVAGLYVVRNKTYYRKGMEKVAEAGFTEKQVIVEGHTTNYAEGPDNGVPLLLIHGQGSQWQDYMRVLPTLAGSCHVVAVDVYGHGGTTALPAGQYTNARVGALLAGFMGQVFEGPAIVSGHSSGGLLAAWLAAHRPDLVQGVLLEDPPFFSSTMPRAAKTAGGDLMRVTHDFLAQDEEPSFEKYYVDHGNYFDTFGRSEKRLVDYSSRYLSKHPGEPLQLFFLPPSANIFFRGLVGYDPAFGAAWYDGHWYEGFDTAESLAAIDRPAVLIHANYWYQHKGTYYSDEGVLMAASSSDDVAKVQSLVDGLDVTCVDSGHLVHFEKPDEYLRALDHLCAKIERRRPTPDDAT